MKMIGHHDLGMERHVGSDTGRFEPLVLGDFAVGIQDHLAFDDLPEKTGPILTDQRDKVQPRLTVIVAGEPDRAAVMAGRIVGSH
jgi:hypothetical protein